MIDSKSISGFSKFTRQQKTEWLQKAFNIPGEYIEDLLSHLHTEASLQELYENFSENTVSNFFIPYGLAPNFLINDKWHTLPMAIEESSVVAAASHAAKFWSAHGGFKAEVTGMLKIGQVHFSWTGNNEKLQHFFAGRKNHLLEAMLPFTASMRRRGGGIRDLQIIDQTHLLENYFQLHVEFYTADAMGANFINTVLEELSKEWAKELANAISEKVLEGDLEINMSILSNYTPESLVRVSVSANVNAFSSIDKNLTGKEFAKKFVKACEIASADTYRAVTHNKGIFNGIDAVVIATGNDFRAVEACGHAYAARYGKYTSLSKASIKGSQFTFELEIAMSVGTVGGLTSLHPLAKTSLKILDDPSAEQLMMIIAAAGLANNFSALRSLITSGIQHGHMKMHLSNILLQLGANDVQKNNANDYFKDKAVTYAAVKSFLSDSKN